MQSGSGAIIARCITDQQTGILEADARFLELVQREMAEIRGLSVLELTHEHDRAPNRLHIDNLRNHGQPFVIVKRYVRADASVCWVRNHVSCTRDGLGGTVLLGTIELLDPPLEGAPMLLEVARRILKRRALRCGRFGEDIFSEPAADILVDLFVNEQMRREVCVSSACLASHVPPTTALRHIGLLEDRGLVVRVADPFDKRRFLVELTELGRTRVTAMLEAIAQAEAR